jgi:hypothetical protein
MVSGVGCTSSCALVARGGDCLLLAEPGAGGEHLVEPVRAQRRANLGGTVALSGFGRSWA